MDRQADLVREGRWRAYRRTLAPAFFHDGDTRARRLAELRSLSRAYGPRKVVDTEVQVVRDDRTGARVADTNRRIVGRKDGKRVVVQELRRFPPARVFADSPLLMREHWWYLPRLVLDLDVEGAAPTTVREAPYDHLLVVAHDETLEVRAAGRTGAEGPEGSSPDVVVDGTPPAPGPAVLFGQDASFPDLERWTQWRWTGHWDGRSLAVSEAPATTGLGPPPGLVQRWRRQRDLERRCTAAIPRPGRT